VRENGAGRVGIGVAMPVCCAILSRGNGVGARIGNLGGGTTGAVPWAS
jgi:hypothetical protein